MSIQMPLLEVNKASVLIEMPLLLSFSLTNYTAIFLEVMGSFGVNNNQIWGVKLPLMMFVKDRMTEMRATINWELSKMPSR